MGKREKYLFTKPNFLPFQLILHCKSREERKKEREREREREKLREGERGDGEGGR